MLHIAITQAKLKPHYYQTEAYECQWKLSCQPFFIIFFQLLLSNVRYHMSRCTICFGNAPMYILLYIYYEIIQTKEKVQKYRLDQH